jgi:hypothetical protein
MIVATILCGPRPAWAELHVRMPTVEYHELEFEHNGSVTFDKKGSDLNGQQSFTNSIGYGVLPWWKIELEGELAGGPGVERTWEATTIENWFQLTEPGKYFVNAAIFVEYSQATGQTNPNSDGEGHRPFLRAAPGSGADHVVAMYLLNPGLRHHLTTL